MFRDPVHDLAEPRTPSVPADPRPSAAATAAPPAAGAGAQRESLADLDGGWGGRTGRSPLEIMAQGDMISLYETFRRIDVLRGAQW